MHIYTTVFLAFTFIVTFLEKNLPESLAARQQTSCCAITLLRWFTATKELLYQGYLIKCQQGPVFPPSKGAELYVYVMVDDCQWKKYGSLH